MKKAWAQKAETIGVPYRRCRPGRVPADPLEDVNSGRILIGDKDVTDVQPKDRDIAMVFQNYALYPHMSVHDNIGIFSYCLILFWSISIYFFI